MNNFIFTEIDPHIEFKLFEELEENLTSHFSANVSNFQLRISLCLR